MSLKKAILSKLGLALIVVGTLGILALGVFIALYVTPPVQRTVEQILPNSLFAEKKK